MGVRACASSYLDSDGGGSALASHTVKTGMRVGVNASPEPFSNVVASLLEDLGVAGLVSFAVFHPVTSAIITAVMLVAGIVGTLPNCGVSEWLGYRMAKGPHRCGPPPAQICSG